MAHVGRWSLRHQLARRKGVYEQVGSHGDVGRRSGDGRHDLGAKTGAATDGFGRVGNHQRGGYVGAKWHDGQCRRWRGLGTPEAQKQRRRQQHGANRQTQQRSPTARTPAATAGSNSAQAGAVQPPNRKVAPTPAMKAASVSSGNSLMQRPLPAEPER